MAEISRETFPSSDAFTRLKETVLDARALAGILREKIARKHFVGTQNEAEETLTWLQQHANNAERLAFGSASSKEEILDTTQQLKSELARVSRKYEVRGWAKLQGLAEIKQLPKK